MEKLQPLITHKFWVIAGLAILIPFVGWLLDPFGTTAGLIDNRIKTIKSTTVVDPNGKPNQNYITDIEAVNNTLRFRQTQLDALLYEEQADYHTWPKNVADAMKDKIFYDPIPNDICDHFRGEHYNEVDTMLAKMNRFNWDTGKGVVEVYPDIVPPNVDRAKWNDTPPTPREVWETQEDVWLTRSILNAIKKVITDEGATKLADSPIPEIFKIELRGGSRPKPVVEGEGQGEGQQEGGMINPGQDGGGGGLNNLPYSPPGGRGQDDMMEGGGGGNQTNFLTDLNIDLNTVFGSDALQVVGQGNAEGGGGEQNINPAPAFRGAGEGNNNKVGRRYVDDALDLPYKTRGFYMEVHMQHEKLPHLQAALVSMPWPTELLMVQQVSKLDDKLPLAPGENKGAGGRRPAAFGAGNQNPGFGARPNNFGRPGGRPAFGHNPQPFGVGARPMGLPGGGGGFPRRPMRGGGESFQEGPMATGNNQEKDPYVAIQNSRDKALEDPGLVKVGIAGLMTIYRSPDEIKRNKAQLGQSPDESGNPMTTDPMTTDPMTTDPMTTDPMTTDPMTTDPMTTDPMTTDPMTTDPMTTDPMTTDPMATDPMTTDPKPNPTPPQENATEPAEKTKPAPVPASNPGA